MSSMARAESIPKLSKLASRETASVVMFTNFPKRAAIQFSTSVAVMYEELPFIFLSYLVDSGPGLECDDKKWEPVFVLESHENIECDDKKWEPVFVLKSHENKESRASCDSILSHHALADINLLDLRGWRLRLERRIIFSGFRSD